MFRWIIFLHLGEKKQGQRQQPWQQRQQHWQQRQQPWQPPLPSMPQQQQPDMVNPLLVMI